MHGSVNTSITADVKLPMWPHWRQNLEDLLNSSPRCEIFITFRAKIAARYSITAVVAQLCPILCPPIVSSMLGFPVLHFPLELAQTHVHWVGDAIQPSHPLSSPPSPAFNLSRHLSQVFSNESALCIRCPKYWSFSFSIRPSNEYSGLISFRITVKKW